MAMLRSLMFLLIIFSMGNANVVLEEKCPYGWTNYGLQCYKYFPDSVNWITAEKNCQSFGGNLASVRNKSEDDFLQSLLPSFAFTRTWIGGHDGVQEGKWLWTDGSVFQYTHWCYNQPKNDNVDNCLELLNIQIHCWHDFDCLNQNSYICETEL